MCKQDKDVNILGKAANVSGEASRRDARTDVTSRHPPYLHFFVWNQRNIVRCIVEMQTTYSRYVKNERYAKKNKIICLFSPMPK